MELPADESREWYRVCVDTEYGRAASFVLRAYDEDHAKLKATYYCDEKEWLGIYTDTQYPWGIHAKLLEPLEEHTFNILGDSYEPVRLMDYPMSKDSEPVKEVTRSLRQSPEQDTLFSVDMRGRFVDYADVIYRKSSLKRIYAKMRNLVNLHHRPS